MNRFSKTSLKRLETCHPDLQLICHEAIKVYDFSVLCGFRDALEQENAFLDGHSQLRWPDSKHNKQPSMAIDIIPYPLDFEDKERLCQLAGIIKGIAHEKNIPIKWGGDFKGFFDGYHFEVVE